MGDSNIEWTDKTWNPWSGCRKVSAGCANCYAAALPPSMRRNAVWGADTPRMRASAAYLEEPFAWQRKAVYLGKRIKVFCASTADFFEDREELDPWRDDAIRTMEATPNLDWLVLTKRTENAVRYLQGREMPKNVSVGTSVENQAAAVERIHHLLNVRARLFLSMEPLLGAVDLENIRVRVNDLGRDDTLHLNALTGAFQWQEAREEVGTTNRISWVIVGGESGRNARPMHPDWARSIREQCVSAGVPFFFKQWGEWIPRSHTDRRHDWHAERTPDANGWRVPLPDGCRRVALAHDGSLSEATVWNGHDDDGPGSESYMHRVGKDATGRMLDGREWSEFPAEPQQPALFGATP